MKDFVLKNNFEIKNKQNCTKSSVWLTSQEMPLLPLVIKMGINIFFIYLMSLNGLFLLMLQGFFADVKDGLIDYENIRINIKIWTVLVGCNKDT